VELLVEQPVALGVVSPARGDRFDDQLQGLRAHLAVAAHHGGDVDGVLAPQEVTGLDRAADAAVLRVLDGHDALLEGLSRSIRASFTRSAASWIAAQVSSVEQSSTG